MLASHARLGLRASQACTLSKDRRYLKEDLFDAVKKNGSLLTGVGKVNCDEDLFKEERNEILLLPINCSSSHGAQGAFGVQCRLDPILTLPGNTLRTPCQSQTPPSESIVLRSAFTKGRATSLLYQGKILWLASNSAASRIAAVDLKQVP